MLANARPGVRGKLAIRNAIPVAMAAAIAAKPNQVAPKIAAMTIFAPLLYPAAPANWNSSNAPRPAERSVAATAGANAIARNCPRLIYAPTVRSNATKAPL